MKRLYVHRKRKKNEERNVPVWKNNDIKDFTHDSPPPTHQDGKLVLVGKRETKGSVWAVEGFQGKLLSSVNHRVYLHR